MSSLFDSGVVRAGVFFGAAFLVASAFGALLGDLPGGMRTGAWLGLVLAVLGYAFVRPTSRDEEEDDCGDENEDEGMAEVEAGGSSDEAEAVTTDEPGERG